MTTAIGETGPEAKGILTEVRSHLLAIGVGAICGHLSGSGSDRAKVKFHMEMVGKPHGMKVSNSILHGLFCQ